MGVIKKSEVLHTPEDRTTFEKKIFFQSCYIVKIHGEYYISYFKEILNKKMEDLDFARMNTIALLLEKWNILKMTDKSVIDEYGSLPSIFVVPYKDKHKYDKRNKISSKQMSNFIQIQIKKMEVEKSLKDMSGNEKIN
jgi:hypothetical protein